MNDKDKNLFDIKTCDRPDRVMRGIYAEYANAKLVTLSKQK